MIEYSVHTQEEIERIIAAKVTNESDVEWADAFQDFLNEEASNGWRITSIQWIEAMRSPRLLITKRLIS